MTRITDFFTASIQRKILSGFVIVIILLLAMIFLSYYQLNQVRVSAQQIPDDSSQLTALQDLILSLTSLEANLERFFVIGGAQFEDAIAHDLETMATALEAQKDFADEADDDLAMAEAEKKFNTLTDEISALLAAEYAELSSREINEKIIAIYSQTDDLKALVQELAVSEFEQLHTSALQQERTTSNLMTQFLVMSVILSLIVVGASVVVTRSIALPLAGLAQTANQIAEGNLEAEIPVVKQRDEVGQLAVAFHTMTDRLRDLIDTLEERVNERTRALETSADISSQIIAIRELDQLLGYVVNRIQEQFGFYHTHIYLIETETGDLVMVEGSGEVGRQLKEKGHRLEAGRGIVGTVASTNQAFLSNNVDDLLNFVRNPLLPETSSELAVPLRKGNDVLGVLDIQSEQLNRFSQSDLSLMQAIANQTAVAIDNARLLAETQVALTKVERLNRQLTGEIWEQAIEEQPVTGYRFIKGVSLPFTREADIWLPPMKQAAVKKQMVKAIHPGNGEPPRSELAVPLVLRGQVIGTLGLKREEAADWNEDELSAVESVANQITLALENARLSEEQAKTIVQLKDVDRLKSEFLTSMSHELRTPLNSIIGFADVILQGIDGDLPDLAMNDVRLIYNSGHHLLALINDILDLAKIEAGKMELVREPINVARAIKEVLAASRSLLKDKPIQVVVETAEDLPAIYADKLRFNQILLNLVSNAAKFTEKGEIILAARVYDPEPDKMFVSVTDSGIGIAPDKLDTIFDRFRQADSSTTRKYGGTGLGLPICKQLVEMHSGYIGVVSSVGKGSTFYFTIPLVQEAVAVEG